MARQRQYDLIVFDWDGTLSDSTALIVNSIQAACRDMGIEVPDRKRAAHVIGLSLIKAVAEIAPDLEEEALMRMAERYRYHFLAGDHELELFEGARELLDELKGQGYLLAVATGKARRGLDRAMASMGLNEVFHATRCADESFSKPHPGMLLELMDEFVTEPSRTLMVGDTTHDLLMAQNAGVASLAMSYGAHPVELLESASPEAVLHSISDLRNWLETHG